MKTMKKHYEAPALLDDLLIEMEGGILASSVVVTDDTEVVSTGQEYEDVYIDMDTHSWE